MLRWLITSPQSPNAVAYSLCGSSSTMCAAGFFCRIERRISAVVHDLPVPVVPRMAKCLPSRSSTRIIAEIDGILADAADAHGVLLVAAEGELQLLARGDAHAVAERGIDGDAAVERGGAAVRALPQLADQAELGDPQLALAFALGRHRHAQAPRRWRAPPCWSCRWRTACPSRAAAWARAGDCRRRRARPRASRWPSSR